MSTPVKPIPTEIVVRDEECERNVLGTLMSYEGTFYEVEKYLNEDCFYTQANKDIYKAIKAVIEKNDEPNIITVFAELQKMGSDVAASDLGSILSEKSYSNYISLSIRLSDLAARRKLWTLGQKLIETGTSETISLESVSKLVEDSVNNAFEGKNETMSSLSLFVKDLFKDMDNNLSGKKEMSGSFTGFKALDDKGGLQKGDLIIVAGETSMGKTSFALSIARNTVKAGNKVAIYSKEMMGKQIAARLLSMETGNVSSSDILYSTRLSQEQINDVFKASSSLNTNNVMVDESSTSSVEAVVISIRNMVRKEGIIGVVIDYLQLFDPDSSKETREAFMGRASRRFKNVAKDLGIWVILISQLSRSDNPVPTMSRLRDSGQIAEAADLVLLIFRPEYYNVVQHKDLRFPDPYFDEPVEGRAMIDVAKGRNVGTMQFLCAFNNSITCFSDLSETESQQFLSKFKEKQPEYADAPF